MPDLNQDMGLSQWCMLEISHLNPAAFSANQAAVGFMLFWWQLAMG